MTTQYIPFSQARKNLSALWKKAVQENIRFVVLVHSKPAFDISPSTQTNISVYGDVEDFSVLGEKSFDFWEGNDDDIFMNCNAIR